MRTSRSAMTEGKIVPSIVMFSLPLLGSSLVQQLYNTVDLLFVGNFTGKNGAAAVGSSGLVFTCLIGLFTGISVGVNVLIAQAVGAKRWKEASRAAHTALMVGFLGSILLTVLGILGAGPILKLLRTPDQVFAEAIAYVRIYFLSMISMVVYNMGSSILRAYGDSRTPFYVLIVGGVTNVAADYLFVAFLRQGVAGAAVATSISQTVSAVGILWCLCRGKSGITVRLRELYIDWGLVGRILRVGLPSGVQSMVITLSNIIVQWYINGYGDTAMAAFAAYFKLENFIYMPNLAFGQAVTTFVGQNLGAGNRERIKKGTAVTGLMAVGMSVIMAVAMLSFKQQLFRCFVDDREVVALGVQVVAVTFPFYWLYGILEVAGGAVRGMGRAMSSMCVTLSCLCIGRICLLAVSTRWIKGLEGVAVVYPVTWGMTAVLMTVLFWKRFKRS